MTATTLSWKVAQLGETPRPHFPQTTQPEPTPQFPTFSPYVWQDIGIIGFVVVSLAIALGKWLPDHLNQRWEVRKKEIEQAIERQEQSLKAELLRDEHDQKLVADVTKTLLAKELSHSEELLENLAHTQGNISLTLEVQSKQSLDISNGFKASVENQEHQIELLKKIYEVLQNKTPLS
jgi:small-conductance mechanosensitive channel